MQMSLKNTWKMVLMMSSAEKICLRCGKQLPAYCSPTKKYCDACAKERNRELTRERMRRECAKRIRVERVKQDSSDRMYCIKCEYASDNVSCNLCDYLLITGKPRGCKYGVGCTERVLSHSF